MIYGGIAGNTSFFQSTSWFFVDISLKYSMQQSLWGQVHFLILKTHCEPAVLLLWILIDKNLNCISLALLDFLHQPNSNLLASVCKTAAEIFHSRMWEVRFQFSTWLWVNSASWFPSRMSPLLSSHHLILFWFLLRGEKISLHPVYIILPED